MDLGSNPSKNENENIDIILIRNDLVYDFKATIPYTSLDLPLDASNEGLKNAVHDIISVISNATGLTFSNTASNYNPKNNNLTDFSFMCIQDKDSRPENNIRLFWRLRTASKWLRDEDSIVSASKLLRDNDLDYIKILDLDDNTNETTHKDYLAFSFEYLHIEKSLFRSAGVDATFNLRENLKQCFVIVGEFNCEGYPLAAVFSEEDNGGQVFLSKYVSKVSDMGYDFKYITTDMASTNVIDINKAFPMPQSNSAFG
ncbi:hypothetical protein C6P44_001100, partial [Monosporozyma unispora]